jgi:hypothetical protein
MQLLVADFCQFMRQGPGNVFIRRAIRQPNGVAIVPITVDGGNRRGRTRIGWVHFYGDVHRPPIGQLKENAIALVNPAERVHHRW